MDEDTYMALICLMPHDFEAASGFEQHLHDIRMMAREHYMTMSSSSSLSLWQPAPHPLSEYQRVSILATATQRLSSSKVELIELFGGKAGCTSIAIRRNMRTLQNIDLCCGIDVGDSRTRHEVYQLVRLRKPFLVIAAPP
eukprot:4727403-Amphidinium_carterae.1